MPNVQLVQAPRPIYPVDITWPAGSIEGGGSVPGGSGWDPNRVGVMAGQSVPTLECDQGGSGGAGVTVTYASGPAGSPSNWLLANLWTSGPRACQFWQHPHMSAMWFAGFRRARGSQRPEWTAVQWWRWYHWLPDPGGVYTGQTTGVGLAAFEGAGLTEADLVGGANPNKLICGVFGRSDGGVQSYEYASFDDTGAVTETVPIPTGAAINECSPADRVQQIDLVIVGRQKPAGGGGVLANLRVHVNDPTGLTPAVERDFSGAGPLFPPDAYTPTASAADPWGIVGVVMDLDGASTRVQQFRWRLRGGRYLPDGSEVPLV